MKNLRDIQKARINSIYGDDLEKSKANIGETREWNGKKYQKQPNGKWLEVSKSHGMTKEGHEDKERYHEQKKIESTEGSTEGSDNYHLERQHRKLKNSLSDKEHTDEEVGIKTSEESGLGKVGDVIREWVGDYNDKQIQSIIDSMTDAGISNKDLKLKRTNNWSQEKESQAIEDKVTDLLSEHRDGLEHATLEKKDVREILHGMVRAAHDGHQVIPSLSKAESSELEKSDITKLLESLLTVEERDSLFKSKAGLTPKKVTIRRKDGTPYTAVRWVNEHGEAPKVNHPKYKHESEHEGGSDEEKISNIVNSESKPIEKQRALISMGVRDKHALDHLSGTQYKDSQHYLKNEAGITDWKDYETSNTLLPSEPSEGGTKITSDILSTVVSDIQDKLGNKKAFEVQQQLKTELIKKYNITIDDKWNGYEDNVTMLLDGELGLRAVMAYGNGGVGKSYTFEKIAEEREMIEFDSELDMENGSDEYDYVKIGGKIGSKEMQKAMYYHRNKLLVFDDCDSMWDDEGLINVLKNTLDTSGKGKCQWAQRLPGKDGEEDVPSIFTFTGRMIFITNKTKKELYEAGAGPVTESRAASTDLSMSMEQTIERLEKILPKLTLKDINREPMSDVTEDDKSQALQALKSVANYARVDQLNTRVLTGIIAKARFQRKKKGDYNQEDLIKVALSQFGLT